MKPNRPPGTRTMNNTLTKILAAVSLLVGIALAFAIVQLRHAGQTEQSLRAELSGQSVALSAIRAQVKADRVADSLAFPGLTATIPDADVLRANRKRINPVRTGSQPAPADLPTAVILRRGEVVPYDSAVVIRYDQYYYAQRVQSRRRTVEITTSARLPDVVLPDFVPTRKEVRRGKWRAFAGGLAVGAVAALALPLVLAH